MLILLFFSLIYCYNASFSLCPSAEERANASYTEEICSQSLAWKYSCCFEELIDNIDSVCCYSYKSHELYKRCGSLKEFYSMFFILILSYILMLIIAYNGPR